jgi:hypothetical protein
VSESIHDRGVYREKKKRYAAHDTYPASYVDSHRPSMFWTDIWEAIFIVLPATI